MTFQNTPIPTAFILAGGLGTNLRPAVSDRPKSLALVQGRPFLAHQIDILKSQEVSKFILCTGHMADMVEELFPAQSNKIEIIHSRESEQLGTGGALRLALDKTNPDEQLFLALNGDTFCDFNLQEFHRWFEEKGAASSMLLSEVDDARRYGVVETDDKDRVVQFQEKDQTRVGKAWINAGIYLLRREAIKNIAINSKISLEREIFPVWMQDGLYAYKGGTRFLDIGRPESYVLAQEYDL